MSSKIILVTEQLRQAREIEPTTSGLDLFGADAGVVAAWVNGELRDLDRPVLDDQSETVHVQAEEVTGQHAMGAEDATDGWVQVEPVRIDSPDGLNILRHSTAHIAAQAVQELHPDAKLGIGPPVTDGFYYDFGVDEPFTPDDLSAIQKQMATIIKQRQRFVRREITDDEGRAELAGEPFKLELIQSKGSPDEESGAGVEVAAGQLTIYDNVCSDGTVAWKDLCQGPHVPHTGYIPAYAITRSSAAYWLGDQANPQLQRVYGTAWPSRQQLKDYQHRLAEAAKRDHRKLGAELDLFSFPEVLGSGLAVFHPKGGVLKREMEDYVRRRHIEEGFSYVGTPHLTKDQLFHTSGHLPKHADTMFPPMELEGAEYRVKPMNCPMHNLIYASRGRSYRELPMRLFEFGQVYRYERSGVVHGLTRVRGMTQDDSHSYVTHDQAPDEIRHLLGFILGLLRDFGLDDYYLELSTRDPDSDKFIGTDSEWQAATSILEEVAISTGLELVPDPGGAAFYGPKISVQARDAIGRSWQLATIQYDFNQPARFGLEYQAADGSRQQPVMIHSAKFGSIERFIGVLTEHYAGAFPPWLAPVQVVGIPVADEFTEYLDGVAARLRAAGVRVEVDDSDDRMQKKIRNATKQKVPYQLIAGGQDRSDAAVSFRYRDGSQHNGVPVQDAVAEITAAIAELRQV